MPDLVLLDRTMPGGPDGYAVLRSVRALAHLQGLPIVMVSGSGENEHVREATEAGANGYIIKPSEQDAYPFLVRQVLAWWEAREDEKMLRTFCATLSPGSSSEGLARVGSSPVMTLPASSAPVGTPENPLAQIARHLGDFLGYVTGGNLPNTSGLLVERKLMEITIACREVGISERHARGKSQDPGIVEKRGKVIKRLMAMEWANTELLEYFEVRRRTMFKLRGEYGKELQRSCTVAALPRR